MVGSLGNLFQRQHSSSQDQCSALFFLWGQTRNAPDEATKDRWDDEIKCLKKLDKKSFKIQIEILVERDDVAG